MKSSQTEAGGKVSAWLKAGLTNMVSGSLGAAASGKFESLTITGKGTVTYNVNGGSNVPLSPIGEKSLDTYSEGTSIECLDRAS